MMKNHDLFTRQIKCGYLIAQSFPQPQILENARILEKAPSIWQYK